MDDAERQKSTPLNLQLNHDMRLCVKPWSNLGVLIAVFFLAQLCQAADSPHEREWKKAVTPRFGLTQVYQKNVRGGISTSSRSGRYAGSHAAEVQVDLDTLFGTDGTGFYILVEGGWPRAGSIDSAAVGGYFGVNADAIGGEWGEPSELWFEQAIADRCLLARVGKLDLTGTFQCRGCETGFDGNKFANDETSQFLNGALVNNPTIPFPDLTFGAAFFTSPFETWHLGCAVAMRDDEDTVWGSPDDGLFAIVEISFSPEQKWLGETVSAQYRAGLWSTTDWGGHSERDEQRGAYLSISQPVLPAKGQSDGAGGLSLFARAGWADGPGAELDSFWSFGLQYQGLWSASDAMGLGMGHGSFIHATDAEALTGSETIWELYYNASITSEIAIGPSVQYVSDPGGHPGADDALVLGLRLQIILE